MKERQLIPSIFISGGKAVTWFQETKVLSEDVVDLARHYSNQGADALLIFDLSDADEEHDEAINLMRKINQTVQIPMIAGGNIRRLEDVKKILYAGADRCIINLSKSGSDKMLESSAKRFGADKIAVSLDHFDDLDQHHNLVQSCASELILIHKPGLNSVDNETDLPAVIVTDTQESSEIFKILKGERVLGVSGKLINQTDFNYVSFKQQCTAENIPMTSWKSQMEFSQFKTNEDGLIPVITQHYRTQQVLMLAYMDEQAFQTTIQTGKMTYYSRSRKKQWVKGETSGHFQYVKSITLDCDNDTLLAKVDQIGPACHTGNDTCFFQPLVGKDSDENNPIQIFESVYETIVERRDNPKEGSYTNYLFDKGIDKILKKLGEESTEVIIAAKNPNPEEIKYELADYLYHAMVLMVEKGITWKDIVNELAER